MTSSVLCSCDTRQSRRKDRVKHPRNRNIKFTNILVQNPVTHNTKDKGRYTSYEVRLDTNDIAFSLPKTCVRRRFSEFEWLLRILKANHRVDCPELPPKQWFTLSGRFDPEVIEKRRHHFECILRGIVRETLYLSDPALHLFLQTNLSVEAMQEVLRGRGGASVQESVLSQAGSTSTEPIRRAPIDRTKHGTFSSGDVTDNSESEYWLRVPADDSGLVIELPRDVLSHVTTRVTDEESSVSVRVIGEESSSSDSDYLSSSSETPSQRDRRRVSFKQELSMAELIDHLNND